MIGTRVVNVILLVTLAAGVGADVCSSPEASRDCLTCVRDSDCAWCVASNHTGSRCASRDTMMCSSEDMFVHEPHYQHTDPKLLTHFRYTHLAPLNMIKGAVVELPFDVKVPENTDSLFLRISNRPGLRAQIHSPNCTHHGSRHHMRKKNKVRCENLPPKSTVSLVIRIVLKDCVGSEHQDLRLFNQVKKRSFLKINVLKRCSCGCEDETKIKDDRVCSYQGAMQCGQCQCADGYHGDRCECDANASQDTCVMTPTSTLSVPCSGRGDCICGQCECHSTRISGRYCECDDASCLSSDGHMCGGHGRCSCDKCFCDPDYTGDTCECHAPAEPPETCLASNGKVCNGHGSCVCGKCVCDAESLFTGSKCEACPTCQNQCDRFRVCVQCLYSGRSSLTPTDLCSDQCPSGTMIVILDTVSPLGPEITQCEYVDVSDGCTVRYLYMYQDGLENVMVKKDKECPVPLSTDNERIQDFKLPTGEDGMTTNGLRPSLLTVKPIVPATNPTTAPITTTMEETTTTAKETTTTTKEETTTTEKEETTTTEKEETTTTEKVTPSMEEGTTTTEEATITTEEATITTEEATITTEEATITTEEATITTEEATTTTEEATITTKKTKWWWER